MNFDKKTIIFKLQLFLKLSLILILSTGLLLNLPAATDSDKELAAFYLKKATRHYNRKEYKKAEIAFQALLKTQISLHEDFYFFYAKVQALNGNYGKAEDNITTYMDYAGPEGQYFQQAKTVQKSVQKKNTLKSLSQSYINNKLTANSSKPNQEISDIPNMVKIVTKTYTMGSNHGDADQRPPHKVKLVNPFAVSQYEITFKQYILFANATRREIPDDAGFGKENRPVINISLLDALAYCEWLSNKQGRNYRLPTEAEWEFIARTTYQNKLGFKDLIGLGDANCDGCRYFWEDAETKPVGSYAANSHKLYDTLGNVWEWTCSAYSKKYNGAEKSCLTLDDIKGKTVAVRGGSWKSHKKILKAYVRLNNYPNYRSSEIGFRIVEDL
ncbi:MAG: SUMF1/EgtB/PvdO family nonheme iron enzyme [Pseudomonadota bacterium]